MNTEVFNEFVMTMNLHIARHKDFYMVDLAEVDRATGDMHVQLNDGTRFVVAYMEDDDG